MNSKRYIIIPEYSASIITRSEVCALARHDGISYVDYTEQMTYTLSLKPSDEYACPPDRNSRSVLESFQALRNQLTE